MGAAGNRRGAGLGSVTSFLSFVLVGTVVGDGNSLGCMMTDDSALGGGGNVADCCTGAADCMDFSLRPLPFPVVFSGRLWAKGAGKST